MFMYVCMYVHVFIYVHECVLESVPVCVGGYVATVVHVSTV